MQHRRRDVHVQESQESNVEEQLSIIHHMSKEIPFSHDDCKTERMKDEVPSLVLCHQHHWVVIYIINVFSSPRLVVDRMEELTVRLLLVESVWRQKESWSFMHLLCSGMVGFGLRRKLGTAGTERHSPPSSSSMAGGILVLSVGFVMFSTVVFLGDLEIYFLVPVSRQ